MIWFLPSYCYVNTNVWMHHIDANKTHREKARWELQRMLELFWINLGSNTSQNNNCTVTYLSSLNHPSKTNKTSVTLLEKQGRTWELIFLLRTFVLILVVFFLFFSLRFSQISPLAFFRWLTVTSDRNAESCNCIPSNYCLP